MTRLVIGNKIQEIFLKKSFQLTLNSSNNQPNYTQIEKDTMFNWNFAINYVNCVLNMVREGSPKS